LTHSVEILTGSPERGVKQTREGETSYFRAKYVNISKTVGDTPKVTIND